MKRPERDDEGYQYALRVLRIPSTRSSPSSPKKVREPPEVLLRALELADGEYHRLMGSTAGEYYHEFAVPAHVQIEAVDAKSIEDSLRMRMTSPGVLGPEALSYRDGVYKVWIEVFPCG